MDRVKSDLNNVQLQHQEALHQLNTEVNNLRRELQDNRSKAKIVIESKTRVEMELINVRSELGRMEMEAHKQSVTQKENEAAQLALEESLTAAQATQQSMAENATKLKGVVIELEEAVQRKNTAIEGLKEDLVHLERDGLLEIRRLR